MRRLQEMHHSRSTLIPLNGKSVKWTVSFITKPSDEMHWHISKRRHLGAMLGWYFKCHGVIISLMSHFAWGWWLADYEDYLFKKEKPFKGRFFFCPRLMLSGRSCRIASQTDLIASESSLFVLSCFSVWREVAEKLVCGLDVCNSSVVDRRTLFIMTLASQ